MIRIVLFVVLFLLGTAVFLIWQMPASLALSVVEQNINSELPIHNVSGSIANGRASVTYTPVFDNSIVQWKICPISWRQWLGICLLTSYQGVPVRLVVNPFVGSGTIQLFQIQAEASASRILSFASEFSFINISEATISATLDALFFDMNSRRITYWDGVIKTTPIEIMGIKDIGAVTVNLNEVDEELHFDISNQSDNLVISGGGQIDAAGMASMLIIFETQKKEIADILKIFSRQDTANSNRFLLQQNLQIF